MAHRTLNPRTAFGLDAREIRTVDRPMPKFKKHNVDDAWGSEFPGTAQPHYWGCLPFEIYPKLEERGWKFSSKHGWRKIQKRLTANTVNQKATINCSQCNGELTGGTDTYGSVHKPLCQSCWFTNSNR